MKEKNEFLDLFNEMSFKEKYKRIYNGLKQPKDSGEYKFALMQLIHLWSWVSAILMPVLLVLLLMVCGNSNNSTPSDFYTTEIQPEAVEKILDDVEPIKEELPEPEPPDKFIETESAIDAPGYTDSNILNPAGPEADFSPQPRLEDSVAIIKSPITFKGIIGSRDPGSRGTLLTEGGGGGNTEGAVMRALRWLKKNQNSDGSWEGYGKAGVTGLALLTYLAHGETPTSEEFGPTVEKAIKWLVANQKDDGHWNGADGHDYSTPICAYAMSEAYALTKVPIVKTVAEKGIEVVIKGQHPSGGWDYNLQQSDRDDTSYMGWCCQALKAAYMAKLENPDIKKAIKKAIIGFKKNANPIGYFGYNNNAAVFTGLTGAGVLCMQLTGGIKEPEVKRGLEWMVQNIKCDWATPGRERPIYIWYYVTQAFFHHGGDMWKGWNKQFSPTLVKQQIIEKGAIEWGGKQVDIGHWETPDQGEKQYGRVYDTTLCALMLQVYYRYLPTYKAPKEIEEQEMTNSDTVQVLIKNN